MDPIEQQVIQAYMQTFGREPRQEALDFYSQALSSGYFTPEDLINELQNSDEMKFRNLYESELGRQPGIEAVDNYLASLQYGNTLENVQQQIRASDEYQTRNAASSADFGGVSNTYNRPPNTSGGIASLGAAVGSDTAPRYTGPAGSGTYVDTSGQPITFDNSGINTTTQFGGFTRFTGRDNRPVTSTPTTPATPATPTATVDYRQQVIDAYANAFGPDRVPRQNAIDAYAQALESGYFTPESLLAELQGSREGQIRAGLNAQGIQDIPLEFIDFAVANPNYTVDQIVQAGIATNEDYNFSLDRNADPAGFVDYTRSLLEGTPREQLRAGLIDSAENTTNTGQLGDIGAPGGIPLDTSGDLASIADLAYTLARSNQLDFPEYQVATLSPEQEAARAEFNEYRGTYIPFLEQGAESTMQGIGTLGEALSGTRDLGAQIPGQIAPGQAALGAAATDIQRFAGEGAEAADIAAQRARQSTEEAQRALQEASGFGLGAAQQGIAGLQGSGEMYTPDMIRPYMNEYEDAAVQQALADLARQGELQERQIESNAVQAGAFGGSRQAVAEQELARNVMEEQGRTAAQMRNTGYENAAQRSQQAFEDAMRRRQQGAMYTGQLGQIGSGAAATAAESAGRLGLSAEELAQTGGLSGAEMQMSGAGQAGNLGLQSANLGLSGIQAGLGAQQQAAGIGQGIAGLGLQSANMGGLAQQYQANDLSTLMQMGQMDQAQRQAQYDAARMNAYQEMMIPFQQLAFASDIMTQTPTGITSVMSQPIQGPSLLSQLGGLVVGGAGLARAFG